MGGLRSRRGERGYILLDALVALIVILIGLAALLGGLRGVGSTAARRGEQVRAIIEERNAHAIERATTFRRE